MLRGRDEAKMYIEFVLMFGGIFVENNLAKRTNLCSAIAKGNKLCDLMTTNSGRGFHENIHNVILVFYRHLLVGSDSQSFWRNSSIFPINCDILGKKP